MIVKTRFAPSPTGYLHIGGVRTALYNYIYAKQHSGQYYIRIEDTDKVRSTNEAIKAIIEGLDWLDINSDFPIVFQSKNIKRHVEVANILLENKKAYRCYLTIEEQDILKEKSKEQGLPFRSPWRDKDIIVKRESVIRLKMPDEGSSEINDIVQGVVKINNSKLDDMVILRSDNTPTYMLAVVVDDYDIGITHIIRGDDHLNNAFRQMWVYKAMGWEIPKYAHLPLIHGQDGKKLSKRHGAIGVSSYKDQGFLSDALNSYLISLGWGRDNLNEYINIKMAIKEFQLNFLGKSPSRFDFKKLNNINSYFINNLDLNKVSEILKNEYKEFFNKDILLKALTLILDRSSNTLDIIKESKWLFTKEFNYNENDLRIISTEKINFLNDFNQKLPLLEKWEYSETKIFLNSWLEKNNCHIKDIGPSLRISLTGQVKAPDLIKILSILGPKEISLRINRLTKHLDD